MGAEGLDGSVKECTFCGGAALAAAFVRENRRFVRCTRCRAFLQATPPRSQGEPETWECYEEGAFASRIQSERGATPDFDTYEEFERYLLPGRLLEIGPGTGHFLAAARDRGFQVLGIETSPYHREYIARTWSIDSLGEPLEWNRLPENSFDNVVSFNCLEHIPQPTPHLAAALRVLRPGGRLLVSTANADALVPRIVGRYWSMFRPPDHVSIPSSESLSIAADRAGLRVLRIWCSEYPLETPLGFAVALRDWVGGRSPSARSAAAADCAPSALGSSVRGLVRSKGFSWVAALTSRFMMAGSIKALYEKPA